MEKTGDLGWIQNRLYTFWQIIRHHPDYVAFCDKNSPEFNDAGILDSAYDDEAEEIRKRFKLDLIFHYDIDFSPDDFTNHPIFSEPFVIEYLWREESPGVHTPLWNSNHIHLKVDISGDRSDGQLKDELLELVQAARLLAGIETKKPSRSPTDKDLRVYELSRAGKSHTEIIKEVWPQEYQEEISNSNPNEQDKLYKELSAKYSDEGLSDWDEKAYNEAYPESNKEDAYKGGRVRLYVRVGEKLKKMKKLFKEY